MIEDVVNKFVDYVASQENIYFKLDLRNNKVILTPIEKADNFEIAENFNYLRTSQDYIKDLKKFIIDYIKSGNIKANDVYGNNNALLFMQIIVLFIDNDISYSDFIKKMMNPILNDIYVLLHSNNFDYILSLFFKAFDDDTNIKTSLNKLNNDFIKMQFNKLRTERNVVLSKMKKEKRIKSTVDTKEFISKIDEIILLLNRLIKYYYPFTDEQKSLVDLKELFNLLDKNQKLSVFKTYIVYNFHSYTIFHSTAFRETLREILNEKTKEYLINEYFKDESIKFILEGD